MKNMRMITSKRIKHRRHSVDGRIELDIGLPLRDSLEMISHTEKVSLQSLGRLVIAGLIEYYKMHGKFWEDIKSYQKKPGRKRIYTQSVDEILKEMKRTDSYEQI